MKILVIPSCFLSPWEEAVKYKDNFDHIIVLGDYISIDKSNFKKSLKKLSLLLKSFTTDELDKDSGKVELILGNWETNILNSRNSSLTIAKQKLQSLPLSLNTWLTQGDETYLFTYGGINYTWFSINSNICNLQYPGLIIPSLNLDRFIKIQEVSKNISNISPLYSNPIKFIEYPRFSPYHQVFKWNISENIVESDTENSEIFSCLDYTHSYILENNKFIDFQSWVKNKK